ncbi:bifunctional phosphoribosyl-AMP cyclohydrolase/phosphoribosyl-ATP diphosphatase HisIE [Crocinitomix catalasitica]|uniref:bifunctional phosphoribosyl-AMP cyclohydrolase/phosphoribosyl-ATP diphosphatase HisIE n=1 Tax=Crocinitomix catalasitica TaxID=184607 RepID=UPI00047F2209|nr:bifunctional phosphoribosyl-AMP cyclohydrolase/phosphoribosyl-ATP diphosphatase HisIE [Crocinitomix catalasitica]
MKIDFIKDNGLVPVIIQHATTQQVLMLGYMNEAAYNKSKAETIVTFYSRSKKRLWTKGESSGNFLKIKSIQLDCDADTLLIQALPKGPTCHTGQFSCFEEKVDKGFLYQLEATIQKRIDENDPNSYTNQLYQRGMNKVAQKVGEEAVELVIEAMDNNLDLFKNEAADLMYHLLILLKAKGIDLATIENVLKNRSKVAN